jgi:hypothetical protein
VGAGRDDVNEPSYRPEFLAALDLLARASQILEQAGKPRPILVGGAVVEFDTLSQIMSGDLDLVAADDEALAAALAAAGFVRENRQGRRAGGWFHPNLPIAVDCVSSRYYDGRGDRTRIRAVAMPSGDVLMAPLEEIVADRIGQWEASDRRNEALREQIALLLALAPQFDEEYVKRRVKEDNGMSAHLSLFKPDQP